MEVNKSLKLFAPCLIAFLAALIPCVALVSTYLLSSLTKQVPFCFPLIHGCTSISSAARQDISIYIFRILMMPNSIILIFFWVLSYNWLLHLGDSLSKRPKIIMLLGIIGALFLLVYVDFLGTNGTVYKLLRHFGVIFYFIFTGLAQILLVSRLYVCNLSKKFFLHRSTLLIVCLLNLLLALAQILVALILIEKSSANNIIEWNFAVLMHVYFLIISLIWFKSSYVLKSSLDV